MVRDLDGNWPPVAGADAKAIAAGDLDGDGRADLAVPNQQANSIAVFLSR